MFFGRERAFEPKPDPHGTDPIGVENNIVCQEYLPAAATVGGLGVVLFHRGRSNAPNAHLVRSALRQTHRDPPRRRLADRNIQFVVSGHTLGCDPIEARRAGRQLTLGGLDGKLTRIRHRLKAIGQIRLRRQAEFLLLLFVKHRETFECLWSNRQIVDRSRGNRPAFDVRTLDTNHREHDLLRVPFTEPGFRHMRRANLDLVCLSGKGTLW